LKEELKHLKTEEEKEKLEKEKDNWSSGIESDNDLDLLVE
jgi:hypothetical protein